jgi:hypothetical protein
LHAKKRIRKAGREPEIQNRGPKTPERVSTGIIFSHKNIKTYLSCPKKGTFGGLPGVALSRGQDIAGHRKKT